MLLFSCECSQQVAVGDAGILVTVLEIRGERVRLGVSAPSGCPIHCQEVWQQAIQSGPPQDGATAPVA